MQERASHLDFDIRFEGARDVLARPHRHEYFQIQVSMEGGSQQVIGGALRPFGAGHLSFVLPYLLHVVPHPPNARYARIDSLAAASRPSLMTFGQELASATPLVSARLTATAMTVRSFLIRTHPLVTQRGF